MAILLRLAAPALMLGAVLLLGERTSNPPGEPPAAEMSAAPDDQHGAAAPCPVLHCESASVQTPTFRPVPAAARPTEADAPREARSLSPPLAA